MSAGLIAQAVLGGAKEVGQGIGDRIRADAQLKRQQALEDTRTSNQMQAQAHGSALRIGEDNLQREHSSGESARDRKHQEKLAGMQHKQSKDLLDYKLSGEMALAREKAKAEGKLSGDQEAYLERINGDIDHLQRMERELSTGKTGEFGEFGIVTPENSGEKIREIRQRVKAREIAFNRILGGTRGTDPSLPILNQAATITDPAERQEFMADLKSSRVYSDDLAGAINEVWGAESKPAQSQGSQRTEQPAPPPAQPQSQPPGGLISQAQAQTSQPAPAPSQPAQSRPPMPDTVDMSPNNNAARTLQEQIIARSREEGKGNYQKAAKSAEAEVQSTLGSGKLNTMDKNQKQAFLLKHADYIRAMSPEVIEQLKQTFGEQAINQYLN